MEIIKIIAQLDSVKTLKDGGGKIVLDFGADSIEEVLKLQRLNAKGDTNLAIAITVFDESLNKDTEFLTSIDLTLDNLDL